MKECATDHFNSRRGNCAQAVALAWKDKQQPESDHQDRFSSCGHGQAPEGACGALYAACELAHDSHKEAVKEKFSQQASGHTTCREIRRNRIMPCADCVATAAGILEELTKENLL
jgi:hypothetical protein